MLTPEDIDMLDELLKADIAEYLGSKCDHGFVVLMSCDEQEGHSIIRKWKGNSHTCMGLAIDLVSKIQEDLDERYYDMDNKPL